MQRSRPITFLASAAVIPLTALAVAACGGGGAAATAASPPSQPKPASAPAPTLRVANSSLGSILVDATGHTLYLFKADRGTKSMCSGACATAWPPLVAAGHPTAGTGLTASKLGTTTGSDGKQQVTYNGHPLYLFIKDKKPGQTNGQGVTAFGAAWFALSPAGNQISSQPKRHGGSASSSRPAAPAVPAAPKPAPQPTPPRTTTTASQPAPPAAAKPAPPASSGIPQNNGGDGDADNNGGPSDGDGNV